MLIHSSHTLLRPPSLPPLGPSALHHLSRALPSAPGTASSSRTMRCMLRAVLRVPCAVGGVVGGALRSQCRLGVRQPSEMRRWSLVCGGCRRCWRCGDRSVEWWGSGEGVPLLTLHQVLVQPGWRKRVLSIHSGSSRELAAEHVPILQSRHSSEAHRPELRAPQEALHTSGRALRLIGRASGRVDGGAGGEGVVGRLPSDRVH